MSSIDAVLPGTQLHRLNRQEVLHALAWFAATTGGVHLGQGRQDSLRDQAKCWL